MTDNETRRSLLLVDDDPLVIKVYAERMKHEGWTVAVARDGWEACQEAGRKKFDMILLDIRMPFHDGVEYVVRILEASREQGKYWETLETMLATQRQWTQNHTVIPERIAPAIASVGLDMAKLEDDMKRMDVLVRMERDQKDAVFLQVRQTPGYYVNGRPLTNFGREQLAALVREELAKAYPR